MPKIILDTTLYSIKEACSILETSRPTLFKYIRIGKLRSTMIGGKRYIPKGSIITMLNGGAAAQEE